MSNQNIMELLKNFNQNQLREINAFLNSDKGKKIKNSLSDEEKRKLLSQFSRLDPASVKRAMNGMSSEDIIKMINKL